MGNAMSGMNTMGPPGMTPPPLPTVAYHVAINGQATGPHNLSVIQQMISMGQITAETLVWKANMATWAKAGEVDELKILFSAPPVPPPIPTSEG